jgi:Paf1
VGDGVTVVPDFEHWANNYVLITFDSDPTEDHERLSTLTDQQRRAMIGRACRFTCSCSSAFFRVRNIAFIGVS